MSDPNSAITQPPVEAAQEPVALPMGYVSPNRQRFANSDTVDGGYLLRHGWTADLAAPATGWRTMESAPKDDVGYRLLRCATEGCNNPAHVHFERGGVGSYYCRDCYLKVQSLAVPPLHAEGE